MKLFSLDSPVIRFLSKTADIILLNALFLVCCIPVVTVGASLTALYTVTLKMTENEESYLIKSFFISFFKNFRQSTFVWCVLLLISGIAVFDFFTVPAVLPYIGGALHILLGAVILLCLLTTVYIFPCIARYEDSLKIIVKNSFLIGAANLPMTFVLFLLLPLTVIVSFCFGLSASCLFFTLFGFSLNAFASSFLLRKIFAKYEPAV